MAIVPVVFFNDTATTEIYALSLHDALPISPVPTVIVEEAVAGLGLKLAVAPPGNPLTLKATAAVKPPEGVMLTAYVVPAPWDLECAPRDAEQLITWTAAVLLARVTDLVRVR